MLYIFSDKYFYYIWKPPHLASTLGKHESIIWCIWSEWYRRSNPLIEKFYCHQTKYFNMYQEYGLCNRLDNKTGGLLYFARHPDIRNNYHHAQSEWKIKKYYVADITGKWHHADKIIIMNDIYHHPSDIRKMVIGPYNTNTLSHTYVQYLYYDSHLDRTTLTLQISKWHRHQIRIHLSSLGYTIVGEDLYVSSKYKKKYGISSLYHLRCVGLCLSST